MSRSLPLLALLALSTLAGCEACAADPHAAAQSADAGVVVRSPSAPAVCYVAARERTRLLDDQIFVLCQGAPTAAGPVDCFVAAQRELLLTDPQRVGLCRCAMSPEPVVCYRMLQSETQLTDPQIEQLCAPTLTGALLSNCLPIGG